MRHDVVKHTFAGELRKHLMGTLIYRSLTTKHPAYEHEDEVRLIIAGTPDKLLKYVKTRLRGSEMVPYIPLPWPVRKPENVAKIVIGPAAPLDAERTLKKFLTTLGMKFDNITRSDIPYRAL
jgi:hypothetical protein